MRERAVIETGPRFPGEPGAAESHAFRQFGGIRSPSTAREDSRNVASEATGVGGIAERYAIALFDLADERKALDEVAADLRGLRDLIAGSSDLKRLIRSPVLARAAQGK